MALADRCRNPDILTKMLKLCAFRKHILIYIVYHRHEIIFVLHSLVISLHFIRCMYPLIIILVESMFKNNLLRKKLNNCQHIYFFKLS